MSEVEESPGPVFTRGFGFFLLAVGLLPGTVFVASEWALWHLEAGRTLHPLALLFVFGGTVTTLAGSVGMVTVLFFPRTRRFALRWLTVTPVFLFSTLLASPIVKSIGTAGLERLAARGTPLGRAILAYERERGAPPTRLELLVPSHLSAVPAPGVGFADAFDYRVHRDAEGAATGWRLSVLVPTAVIPDEFVFEPAGGTDPELGRRIGDWVYRPY